MVIQEVPPKRSLIEHRDEVAAPFVLEAYFSPQVRPAASTNAETVQAVLNTTFQVPVDLSSHFTLAVRFCESDGSKSNPRAESMVMEGRPSWQHTQWLCLAHKVHAAATKNWELQASSVSAVIHTCKHLATSGACAKLKVSLKQLTRERFQFFNCKASLTPEAEFFKENVFQYFTPSTAFPKRRAIAKLIIDFLMAVGRPLLLYVITVLGRAAAKMSREACRKPSCSSRGCAALCTLACLTGPTGCIGQRL